MSTRLSLGVEKKWAGAGQDDQNSIETIFSGPNAYNIFQVLLTKTSMIGNHTGLMHARLDVMNVFTSFRKETRHQDGSITL